MNNRYDIIVVGVGAMGSAACFQLARRGVRVLGLEQFDIPHALGSSHGVSRMIRLAYYEHPDYVPLLLRAYELWDELEHASGQKLLHVTGGLYMGRADCELVAQSALAARQHQLAHELLDHSQVASRFPQFRLPSDHVGLFEPRAGFLSPEKVVASYARAAIEAGAEIHGREPVRNWECNSSGVRVRTDAGEYHADKIVFTAGAWTDKLVRDLGVQLVVTRQVMLWFSPPREHAIYELGQMPVWAIDRPAGGLYYGFPISPDDVGLKLACHAPGTPTDPDAVARNPQPGDVDEVHDALRNYLPGFAQSSLLSQRVCLYTTSPDQHFIIDEHPKHRGRVVLACGFSGHGFKFASVVGEILADLSTRGRTGCPVEFLRLDRLSPSDPARQRT